LIAAADYGSGLGSDIPVYDEFTLGGFLNLSGFQRDILQGSVRGFARLLYYRRFGKAPGLLGGDMYLGGSLETGNVWLDTDLAGFDDLRYSGSVFGGVDTLLGPVYLGYGRADGGTDSLYLFLGRII
jgi:NTE family protein